MKGIGLYIHIPFCLSKCSYCDFYSMPCKEVPDFYIKRLIEEHDYRRTQSSGYWSSVYIGGGTPSLLSEKAILSLFASINPYCLPGAEITYECNPSDVNGTLISVLQHAGVNRISLGIQTFSDKKLQFCGRRSSALTNHNALNLIEKAGFLHFSADLIAGLPPADEDIPQLINDIDQLISYKVDHISLYSLSIEDGTPLYYQFQRDPSLINEEHADNLWIIGRDYLEKNGFRQYEVSNFSLNNGQSKHNTKYWNMEDYAGIGSGATGTYFTGKTAVRYTNTLILEDYLHKDFHIQEDRQVITENEYINEFLMMGFRKIEGINPDEFCRRFKIPLKNRIDPAFSSWVERGKAVVRPNGNFALTSEGMLFLNSFLLQIIE